MEGRARCPSSTCQQPALLNRTHYPATRPTPPQAQAAVRTTPCPPAPPSVLPPRTAALLSDSPPHAPTLRTPRPPVRSDRQLRLTAARRARTTERPPSDPTSNYTHLFCCRMPLSSARCGGEDDGAAEAPPPVSSCSSLLWPEDTQTIDQGY